MMLSEAVSETCQMDFSKSRRCRTFLNLAGASRSRRKVDIHENKDERGKVTTRWRRVAVTSLGF